MGGVLVAFMAAGFCMLESGLVTTKSVSTIAAKNIGKFAICSLIFFLVGYNLAYGVPEGGYVGSFTIWTDSTDAETGYSGYSDWFFQTMFVCATASIVSGAVAKNKNLAILYFCSNYGRSYLSNFYGLAMGRRLVS